MVTQFGPLPTMQVESIGYGLGSKDFVIPNVLRLVIGSEVATKNHEHGIHTHSDHDGHDHDHVEVLEANLDDMNPEFCQHALSQILAAGAVDAFYTPIIMKKGRPAFKLTVLCPIDIAGHCTDVIFQETTTLGVRRRQSERTKLDRDWIATSVAGQPVRVKIGKLRGRVVNIAPEYEDCLQAAEHLGWPLKQTYEQAKASVVNSFSAGA
jgi:uncharacterized protein (DUF111 family)